MPLVCATFGALGAEEAAGGLGAGRREDVVGREAVEGRAAGREGVVRVGGLGFGAVGAAVKP